MRKVVIAALAAGVVPGPGTAQEAVRLDEILVSGGRTPLGVDETGRAHTVLTREELEAQGVRYVADALRRVPGVSVTRQGGVGGLTQIRVRGAESNQVLVLIDGIEVAPAADGELDFGGLQVAGIERIEVIRGPQSALYGSNAATGVISIVTRRGERGTARWEAQGEGGSDGTALVRGTLSGGGARWDGAVTASVRRTNGFNTATGTGDREGERDGDQNLTVIGRGSWDVTDALRLAGTVRLVDRESDFDSQAFPFPPDETSGLVVDSDSVTDARDIALALSGSYAMLDDALVHELRFEYTDTQSDSLVDDEVSFSSSSRRYKGVAQSSYAFDLAGAENRLTGAVEVEEEVNEASTGDQTRTLVGLVGEYRVSPVEGLDLQAGLRQDFNDAFEDAFTYSVGASYSHAPTATRFHGSVGRGIVNPTFVEQFGFFPGNFVGNPDLEPERTFMWDVGVEQTLMDGRLVVDATYFRGTVEDEIVSGFDAEAGLPTSVNAEGESPRQGVELSAAAFPVDGLSLRASYTWTLSQEGGTGLQEVRRPRHAASLDAVYRFLDDRATLGIALGYTGERRDLDFAAGSFPAPRTTLDAYFLASVQGSYRVRDGVEVYARVENATDTDYREVDNFETQGIAGFAGLRLSF